MTFGMTLVFFAVYISVADRIRAFVRTICISWQGVCNIIGIGFLASRLPWSLWLLNTLPLIGFGTSHDVIRVNSSFRWHSGLVTCPVSPDETPAVGEGLLYVTLCVKVSSSDTKFGNCFINQLTQTQERKVLELQRFSMCRYTLSKLSINISC